MASFHKSLLHIFFLLFLTLLSFSNAHVLIVGGRSGWTLHPSEPYNRWAGRLRFTVNDTLHFKYNGGSDSVMEVKKGDYDNCNTNNSITTLTGGDSYFNLTRSGSFYFISGNKSNCDQGQKLIVLVIAPRVKQSPAPAASAASSPTGSGTSISGSPAAGAGGAASSSPTGIPVESAAARPAISVTLFVSLAMIVLRLGWFY